MEKREVVASLRGLPSIRDDTHYGNKKPRLSGGRETELVSHRFLFLLFEGKRELEGLIADGNAQHQLLWVFAALEPH